MLCREMGEITELIAENMFVACIFDMPLHHSIHPKEITTDSILGVRKGAAGTSPDCQGTNRPPADQLICTSMNN